MKTINQNKAAFSLVEMVVTIAILGVLSTISFIGVTDYLMGARDSVRLTDIKTANTGFTYYQVKNKKVPAVENPTLIQASGSTIQHQGYLTPNVLAQIGMGEIKDPKTGEWYTYATDIYNGSFQIAGFLEVDNPKYVFQYQAYANEEKVFYAKGRKLGIIEDDFGVLVHTLTDQFDLDSASGNITVYFDRGEKVVGTSGEIKEILIK